MPSTDSPQPGSQPGSSLAANLILSAGSLLFAALLLPVGAVRAADVGTVRGTLVNPEIGESSGLAAGR